MTGVSHSPIERAIDELLRRAEWVEDLALSLVRDPLRGMALQRGAGWTNAAGGTQAPESVELLPRAGRQQQLVELVLDLDEPMRTAILLRFYEDLDSKAAAAAQEMTQGVFRRQLARGLAVLRRRLDELAGKRSTWVAELEPLWLRAQARLGRERPRIESQPPLFTTRRAARIATAALPLAALLVAFATAPPKRAERSNGLPHTGTSPRVQEANVKRAWIRVHPAYPEDWLRIRVLDPAGRPLPLCTSGEPEAEAELELSRGETQGKGSGQSRSLRLDQLPGDSWIEVPVQAVLVELVDSGQVRASAALALAPNQRVEVSL